MESPATTSLIFKVTRNQPELIAPAKATPHEFKQLSDIDDQQGLRFQIPLLYSYPNNPNMNGIDPAKVIKDAISKTLVFYYPFAGRLREGPGRKLFVECTGEGILFIEADADVTLEQFGDSLQPPFPCFDQLLYDVPNSGGIIDCPLLLIQVTRLQCGGFIFALRLNHTMTDGSGFFNFLNTISQIVFGSHAPSILPVWQRSLLSARDPPSVTFNHHEYDAVVDTKTNTATEETPLRSFFFSPSDISSIRKTLPNHLHRGTNYEILSAFLWRCRTIALQPNPEEEVRFCGLVNMRFKFKAALPLGYYGNAFAFPAAVTTAGKLCQNPLGYAVELVRKAKADMTEEYIKSVADFLVMKGRPNFTTVRNYIVSDLTKTGLEDIDLGWGKATYGGPAVGTSIISFFIPMKKRDGDKGILVPICLPVSAMERFVVELDTFFKTEPKINAGNHKTKLISSAL